jgi:DNA-binding response OmpR family regulator
MADGRPLGREVLVVEDEALGAMLLEDVLSKAGYGIIGPMASLESALAAAEGGAMDAALLDINLRGKLSFPVAYVLRGRGVPFIFLSGYAHEIVIPADLRDVVLLAKPYNLTRILTVLSRLIGGRPGPATPPLRPPF